MTSMRYATVDRVVRRAGYRAINLGSVFAIVEDGDQDVCMDFLMELAYEGDALVFGEPYTACRGYAFALENHLSAVLKVRILFVSPFSDGSPMRTVPNVGWQEQLDFMHRDTQIRPCEVKPPACFAVSLVKIKDDMDAGRWPRAVFAEKYPNGQWCTLLCAPPPWDHEGWSLYNQAQMLLETFCPVAYRTGSGCVWSAMYRAGGDWCPPLCLAGGGFIPEFRNSFREREGSVEASVEAVDLEVNAYPDRCPAVCMDIDLETSSPATVGYTWQDLTPPASDAESEGEETDGEYDALADYAPGGRFNLDQGIDVPDAEPAVVEEEQAVPVVSEPDTSEDEGEPHGADVNPFAQVFNRLSENQDVYEHSKALHIGAEALVNLASVGVALAEIRPSQDGAHAGVQPPTESLPSDEEASPAPGSNIKFPAHSRCRKLNELIRKGEFGVVQEMLTRPKDDWIRRSEKITDCVNHLNDEIRIKPRGMFTRLLQIMAQRCVTEAKYMKALGVIHSLTDFSIQANTYEVRRHFIDHV